MRYLFSFETPALQDLPDLLSLDFKDPKLAVKTVMPHIFALKVQGHTGVALGHSLATEREIENVLEFLAETTLSYWWIDSLQTSLELKLQSRGFRYDLSVNLMKMSLNEIKAYEFDASIEVKQAVTHLEQERAIQIICTCFGVTVADKKNWLEYLQANLPPFCFCLYIAYWQGVPAAAALALYQGDHLILDEVCVLPDFRHKGIGCAIVYQVLQEGKRKELKVALLGATDAGGKIYQKLGFTKQAEYKVFDFPNKLHFDGIV